MVPTRCSGPHDAPLLRRTPTSSPGVRGKILPDFSTSFCPPSTTSRPRHSELCVTFCIRGLHLTHNHLAGQNLFFLIFCKITGIFHQQTTVADGQNADTCFLIWPLSWCVIPPASIWGPFQRADDHETRCAAIKSR